MNISDTVQTTEHRAHDSKELHQMWILGIDDAVGEISCGERGTTTISFLDGGGVSLSQRAIESIAEPVQYFLLIVREDPYEAHNAYRQLYRRDGGMGKPSTWKSWGLSA